MKQSSVLKAFEEDLPKGDITTQAIFAKRPQQAQAIIVAKEDLVVSGMGFVQKIVKMRFGRVRFSKKCRDGEWVKKGQALALLKGPVQDLLVLERVCLNYLQLLSGVATLTKSFVAIAKPYGVAVVDTRKTIPGLRDLQKQAVLHGGGSNHRFSLSDQYLIKDNHIFAAGSVTQAIQKVRQHRKKTKNKALIEVEVKNLAEFKEALAAKPDLILLDNMTTKQITSAKRLRGAAKKPLLEVSGGVQLKTLKRYACLGVDRVSVGALTHSARAVDISMNFVL